MAGPGRPVHDRPPPLPARPLDGHKGTFGTVIIIGGCPTQKKKSEAPRSIIRRKKRSMRGERAASSADCGEVTFMDSCVGFGELMGGASVVDRLNKRFADKRLEQLALLGSQIGLLGCY